MISDSAIQSVFPGFISQHCPQYRVIKVRRPGVTLRYREGYYLDEPGSSQLQDQKAEVARAMLSPVDSTAVPIKSQSGLEARYTRFGDVSRRRARMDFALEAGRWQGKLEIQSCFEAADGRRIGSTTSQLVDIKMRPQTHDAVLRTGLVFHITLQIPPDAAVLKQLACDVRSGKIGTLSIPLKMVMSN